MIPVIPKLVWKNVKAVLIDFDGTLADSYPRLFSAFKQFMELNGQTGTKEEFKQLIGYTLPEIVQKIIENHKLKTPKEDLVASYRKIMEQVYNYEIGIFPGAIDVLEDLKNRKLELAIVTSADLPLVEKFLAQHRIRHYFKHVVAPTANLRGKPNPDLYNHALHLLGIHSTQAIAIEDSISGIGATVAAGIYTILIRNFLHEKLDKEYYNILEAQNWDEVGQIFKSS